MIQIYLVYVLLIIWPFHWVKKEVKIGSSWYTDPWSNFWDPQREPICCDKWHTRTSEMSTPRETTGGTHFHGRNGTNLAYLPDDGQASWSLLSSSVSLLSCGTVQPGNTYSCILKVTGQVWESQKRISININHSHRQHSFY